jgi:hypothetical protein
MGPEHDDDESWVVDEDGRSDEADGQLVVPWRDLSAEALRGVIVEFVTREGTEYGPEDVDLETKVAQVRRQLEQGEVSVVWSAKTETVNLATRDQIRAAD